MEYSDNIDGSWEYHAKWNKSDGKGEKLYDFSHMWDIKQEATKMNQANKQKPKNLLIHTIVWPLLEGKKGWGEVEEGKGS